MYTENLYLEMGNIIMEATQEYDVAFYTFHLSLPAVSTEITTNRSSQKLRLVRNWVMADLIPNLQIPEQKSATAM